MAFGSNRCTVKYERNHPECAAVGRLTILINLVLAVQDISHPSFCHKAVITFQEYGAPKYQCCDLQLLNYNTNEWLKQISNIYFITSVLPPKPFP